MAKKSILTKSQRRTIHENNTHGARRKAWRNLSPIKSELYYFIMCVYKEQKQKERYNFNY